MKTKEQAQAALDEMPRVVRQTNFQRGQVYLNPEDMMMFVIKVLYKGDKFKIEYITEEGEFGSFYDTDTYITNNIRQIQ